jgi:hypothetical protein
VRLVINHAADVNGRDRDVSAWFRHAGWGGTCHKSSGGKTCMALVHKRTVLIKRLLLVGQVSANFCG